MRSCKIVFEDSLGQGLPRGLGQHELELDTKVRSTCTSVSKLLALHS